MSLSEKLKLPPRQGIQQELSSCTSEDTEAEGVEQKLTAAQTPGLPPQRVPKGSWTLQINGCVVKCPGCYHVGPRTLKLPPQLKATIHSTEQLWLGTGERRGRGTARLAWGLLCHCGQSWPGCVHLETWFGCMAMLVPRAGWRLGAQLGQLLERLHMASRWWPYVPADFSHV